MNDIASPWEKLSELIATENIAELTNFIVHSAPQIQNYRAFIITVKSEG